VKAGLAAVIIAGLVTGLPAGATLAASVAPAPAPAPITSGLPGLQHELQCVKTAIKEIGSRLLQTPGSGPAIRYTNGGFQVGYEDVPGIDRARVGDPVLMCLISIPKQCPPGDTRGRVYTVTDLRTQESWTLADSALACGGA
jgi:hypothetical protein